MKPNRSRIRMLGILTAIFLFLLVCNCFTAKIADDFSYHFRFDTGERITNIFQIFPSMVGHAQKMNGRLTAHFLVQIFEMLPKGIFNLVNALMFTLQIALIGLIAGGDKKPRNGILLAAFGTVWVLQPAFGQVNLWLDGACNYLWSVVFGLLFLLPFIMEWMTGKRIRRPAGKVLFVLLSFFAGAYSETGSVAVIFAAAVLLVLTAAIRRKRPAVYGILSVLTAFAGYLSIYLAPAQWANKSSSFDFSALQENFTACLEVYLSFWVLLAVFAVLLLAACIKKTDRKRILLSLVLFAGSLVANFMMIAASYYPERSAASAFILLLAAAAVLLQGLGERKGRFLIAALAIAAMIPAVYYAAVGVGDIYATDQSIRENQAYVYECKAQGITDITLPLVKPQTKYSALHGLKYLDTETTETWPNHSMAQYYGVNSILGTD